MYLSLECNKTAFTYIIDKPTAYDMYQSLLNLYEPKEEDDYLTISTAFMKSKMENPNDDPDIWFQEVEYLCQRMKNINADYEKKKIELKTFILTQLPDEYSEVVTNEVKTLSTSSLQDIKIK